MLSKPENCPTILCAGVVAIVGATTINKLKQQNSTTVDWYQATELAAYDMSHFNSTQCVAIFWDFYKSGSLKQHAQQRSGKGVRHCVELNSPR